jgi:phosphate transport system protein
MAGYFRHGLVKAYSNGASPKGYTEVRHIGKSVTTMLDHALTAFANLDATAALEVLKKDEKIDLDYKTALRELMTYMMEDPPLNQSSNERAVGNTLARAYWRPC